MWPEYFPGECPPPDATPQEVQVFRLVDHNPPEKSDFLSHWERYPEKRKSYEQQKNYLAYGISCYKESEYAYKQQELLATASIYNKRKKKHKKEVAEGHTDPQCGVVKETPGKLPSHITYWLHKDSSIECQFKVI